MAARLGRWLFARAMPVTSAGAARGRGACGLAVAYARACACASGAATGVLIGRQQLDQQVFAAFAVSAYEDAGQTLAGAQKKLADTPPPDEESAGLRDRLAPVVLAAVHDLGDAAEASDDGALRAAVDALSHDAQQLDTFIEEHQ